MSTSNKIMTQHGRLWAFLQWLEDRLINANEKIEFDPTEDGIKDSLGSYYEPFLNNARQLEDHLERLV